MLYRFSRNFFERKQQARRSRTWPCSRCERGRSSTQRAGGRLTRARLRSGRPWLAGRLRCEQCGSRAGRRRWWRGRASFRSRRRRRERRNENTKNQVCSRRGPQPRIPRCDGGRVSHTFACIVTLLLACVFVLVYPDLHHPRHRHTAGLSATRSAGRASRDRNGPSTAATTATAGGPVWTTRWLTCTRCSTRKR